MKNFTKLVIMFMLVPSMGLVSSESEKLIEIGIFGEIRSPGKYSVPVGTCLIEAIGTRGKGFTRIADVQTVKVFRVDGTKVEEDCESIIDKLHWSKKLTIEELRKQSLVLLQSDKIFVAEVRN